MRFRSEAVPLWWSSLCSSSGPMDVRILYAIGYAIVGVGYTVTGMGRLVNSAAVRWALVRQHSYTLRGQHREGPRK